MPFRAPPLTRFSRALLVVIFGAYIVQLVCAGWLSFNWMEFFTLKAIPSEETLWQVFTFPFVQDDLMFAITAIFLWFALAPLEQALGVPRVCQLLFVMSVGAAVPVLLLGLLATPAVNGAVLGPLRMVPLYGLGAHLSGAIMAYVWPRRHLGPMNFFGVVQLTAKQLLVLLLVLAALPLLAARDIAFLVGDIGAIAAAIFFVRPRARKPKKKRENKAGLKLVHDDKPKYLN